MQFIKSKFIKYGKMILYVVYTGLQLGPEKIVTKYAISVNAGRLNQDFTVHVTWEFRKNPQLYRR
jgi:hypothetical protein